MSFKIKAIKFMIIGRNRRLVCGVW